MKLRPTAAALAVSALVLASGCASDKPSGGGGSSESASAQLEQMTRDSIFRVRNIMCGGVARGTAFAIDDHTLVTNRHVVEGTIKLELNSWDGEDFEVDVDEVAAIETTDPEFDTNDIAVVKIGESLDKHLKFGKDPDLDQEVVAAGYAGARKLRYTDGEVLDDVWRGDDLIVSTNRVIPGNSGGPLIDRQGKVRGVVFAFDMTTDEALSVPASRVKDLFENGDFGPAATDCPLDADFEI